MKARYIVATLVLIIAAALVLFFIYGQKWAENKLRKQLTTIENLSYDSLHIDLEQNKISFKQLKYSHENLDIDIPSVVVQDINIFKILVQNTLQINLLQLENPTLIYKQEKKQPEKSEPGKPFKVKVDRIDLSRAEFTAYRTLGKEPFVSGNADLRLTNVDIDEINNLQDLTNRLFALKLNNVTYRVASGRYNIYAESILYSKEKNSLLVHVVKVLPQYDKYEFARAIGHEIDWITLSVDSILLKTNTLNELVNHKHISELFIYQPELEVFRDKRLPFPENQRPKILKEILADKDNSFGIDNIFIVDGNITYQELVIDAEQPGVVTFSDLDGQIKNLYTYDHNKNEKPRLTVKSKLFDATTLYADISFPNTADGLTLVKGKVEPVQLPIFNKMLEHVAFTRITSGQLNRLDFEFSYAHSHATGQMKFDYTDLQVAFIQQEQGAARELFNDVKGFVANTFLVKRANTKGDIRIGEINFKRNKEKSMFNFWWKSILSGFKSSTGITSPEEAE